MLHVRWQLALAASPPQSVRIHIHSKSSSVLVSMSRSSLRYINLVGGTCSKSFHGAVDSDTLTPDMLYCNVTVTKYCL
jgi:hypothetical protein